MNIWFHLDIQNFSMIFLIKQDTNQNQKAQYGYNTKYMCITQNTGEVFININKGGH